MGSLVKCLIAGSIGGAVGAGVWAIIAFYAHAEVGWIAWGIGFVVGVFVRAAAGEQFEGGVPGVLAAGIAILAVLAGKYAAVQMMASSIDISAVAGDVTDEQMIVQLADDVIEEREAKGQKVKLPGGKSIDDATVQADYPPDIWKEASQRWTKLGLEVQQMKKSEQQALMRSALEQFRGAAAREAFIGTFGPFDALWFILAAATAFKLGHGNIASDDD